MKNDYKKLFLPALLVLILSGKSRAEDVDLDKIVVTPSRIEESSGDVGRSVDVVTAQEMARSGAQNLADALTNLTSVEMTDYGGPGANKNIRMRGSTAAQVLVMVDGRPVNNPRDGQVDLATIPLDNIGRVEVVHGPGSGIYGSQAMGGVVNIITKNPPKEGQKTELYSSFGTARTYIERLSQGAKVSNFRYLVSGEYQSSQGFRSNSGLNAQDCNLKLGYELNGQNDVSLNSGFYHGKLGTPGPITSPDLDDKQDTLKRFFDFNWNFKPDEKTGIAAKIYQNYDRLEFLENSSDGWNPDNKKDIHTTTVRGVDIQLDKQLSDIYRLVAGFNSVENMNDSTSSAKHKYNVIAGYLQNHFTLFDKLKINFGARLDDYSNFGAQFNPNLDFLYTFNEAVKFHGLVSRSFRAPTFNDLYWPFNDYGPFYKEKGNPNLKPEKGVTGELGAEVRISKYLTSRLTYYRSSYKQLIQWSEDATHLWQPMNVSSAVINGIELDNKIFITDKFGLNLNYTYLMARDEDTHKYLVYQPKNKLDACLKYQDYNGLTIELKGQFTGQRFTDADNNTKIKSFFVLGVSASKKFKFGVTFFAYIDNLLNRKYEVNQGFPMPGFSFTGGLKAEF